MVSDDSAFTAAQYRCFGWLTAALLAVAAWRLPGAAPALLTAAALLTVLATRWPWALRRPHALLALLTRPLGALLSRVLLTLVFYALVMPHGLLFRLLRRDALQCRPDPDAATYWRPCPPPADATAYLRQF
jgi:hypothetical protein